MPASGYLDIFWMRVLVLSPLLSGQIELPQVVKLGVVIVLASEYENALPVQH